MLKDLRALGILVITLLVVLTVSKTAKASMCDDSMSYYGENFKCLRELEDRQLDRYERLEKLRIERIKAEAMLHKADKNQINQSISSTVVNNGGENE